MKVNLVIVENNVHIERFNNPDIARVGDWSRHQLWSNRMTNDNTQTRESHSPVVMNETNNMKI